MWFTVQVGLPFLIWVSYYVMVVFLATVFYKNLPFSKSLDVQIGVLSCHVHALKKLSKIKMKSLVTGLGFLMIFDWI